MSGAAAATALKSSALASPNDTIRVAVVGTRGQGNSHIGQYGRMKDVQIAALVDIDENILDQRLKQIEGRGAARPDRYSDIRKMLEDKTIDCVSIATPNHSHTMQAIWAMQAGKHVYVEKPCSHNIFESQQIVKAARKYDKLVQHGSNSRSNEGLIEAVDQLNKGLLGEVYYSRGLCYKWRDTIGHAPDEPVPAGVHYDEWIGPAPKRPFSKNRFHYNWHWNWDYGNGDFGNQGIHELDICRWGLGVNYPLKVHAMGGHYMFDDDQNTPNTVVITYDFLKPNGKKALMVFEVRHWITNTEGGIDARRNGDVESPVGNSVGNLFYGSEGYMAIEGYTSYKTFLGRKGEPGPAKKAGSSNWQNFIDAVRAGKREMLNAEIEKGAISCTLMHLGNISYRLGRSLDFDEQTMTVKGDAEANRMFTRAYRAPYVVPEKV